MLLPKKFRRQEKPKATRINSHQGSQGISQTRDNKIGAKIVALMCHQKFNTPRGNLKIEMNLKFLSRRGDIPTPEEIGFLIESSLVI